MSLHHKSLIFFFLLVVIAFIIPPLIPLVVITILLVDWFVTRETGGPRTSTTLADSDSLELDAFLATKSTYLQSPGWKAKRRQRLAISNGLCECCNKPFTGRYELHHISGYNLIPNESISHLRLLCTNCHQLQHDFYGYPKTLRDYKQWNTPVVKAELRRQ